MKIYFKEHSSRVIFDLTWSEMVTLIEYVQIAYAHHPACKDALHFIRKYYAFRNYLDYKWWSDSYQDAVNRIDKTPRKKVSL